ncbi:molybdenum ABC transporter substrate-binding protein, partial [Bradyrhizobium sp. NAS80.1]
MREALSMSRLSALFYAFVVLLAAWSPALAQNETLTVFAAASMKSALDEIDAVYIIKTGTWITARYAAS